MTKIFDSRIPAVVFTTKQRQGQYDTLHFWDSHAIQWNIISSKTIVKTTTICYVRICVVRVFAI